METAFVSLICVALIVMGGMTMARGFLTSIDNTSTNIDSISQRTEEIMRTNLSVSDVNEIGRQELDVTVQNIGQIKLSDFPKWDVIVHYTDTNSLSHVTWLPYTGQTPDQDEWYVKSIQTSTGQAEVFEPNILNTDEQLVMEIRVSSQILRDSNALVSITTPNGVTVTKTFVGN